MRILNRDIIEKFFMRDLSREIINLLYLSKKNANIKHIFIYLHIYMKHQLIESG